MAANMLPPPLMALFAPRPPLPYVPPPPKSQLPPYSGVASYLQEFEDPATVDYSQFAAGETVEQRRARVRKAREEKHAAELAEAIAKCMLLTSGRKY